MHVTTTPTDPAGPADARRPQTPAEAATWTVAGLVPVIAIVLVAGLALRLLLAFVVFPQAGLWSDIRLFSEWSLTLADVGPSAFYETVGFSDYTPGYLLVLWLFGIAAKTVAALTGGAAPEIIPIWIKLPAIIADIAVAWVFYRAIRRWHSERWGVAIAAIYLFVPVTWYDSALWGQVDAFGVLVGALTLIWLIDRRPELAAGAAMTAALLKPQFGIFLPIVGFVLLRRHLRRRPVDAPPGPDRDGPLRLLTSAAAAFLVLVVVTVPFDLQARAPEGLADIPVVGDLAGLAGLLADTAGSYDVLTANAFNPWALIGPTPLASAIGGDYRWTFDSLPLLGGVPASLVGTLLFLAVALAVAVLLWRRQDRDAILVSAVILATAFFVLPTRVHERYLFAAIGVGLLLLPRSRAWWAWFAAAAGIGLVNMHAILSLPFRGYGTPEMRALPLAELSRHPWLVAAVALLCIPVMAWPLREAWRLWTEGPTDEPTPVGPTTQPAPAPTPAATVIAAHAAAAAPQPTTPPAATPAPAPRGPRPTGRPGRRALFRGRLGPRELLLALLIAVGLSGIRLVGLERPLGWYFDEDLHGRTATELLQDWRYGRPHELEEWTHPHLAKYLMAASIEALGGHEVTRVTATTPGILDAVLEPQGANGDHRAPGTSRLFLLTDAGITVRELTGDELELDLGIPEAARLAYEPDDRLLWVATDGGTILVLDVSQLDPDAPATETPFITEVAALGRPIQALWAYPGGGAAASDGMTFTVLGPDGELASASLADVADADLVGTADDPRLALTMPDGVRLVSATDLTPIGRVSLARRPLAADLVDGSDLGNRSRDLLPEPRLYVVTRGGLSTIGGLDTDAPFEDTSMALPGAATDVAWNPSTNMVHVLGEEAGRPTIYVVEPHGNTVFADAELPAAPIAWALDVRTPVPAADRQLAVTVAADGTIAEVGLGGTAFASRLPGALLGGIAGALLWLLLLLVSPRRIVATIGLVLVATESLLFAQSRIATPDTATIAFLLAAWTLLAWVLARGQLVRHRWRWLVGLPVVGLLLGLAGSTKWTGLYGLGGVLLFLIAVAAWQRIPRTARPRRDLVPLRVVAWGLVAIPLVVAATYVVLYVPCAFLAGGDPQLFPGWPRGHTGELFVDLQSRMFGFHDGLREGHPSGSPWWSWPLMLKPLWAYLEGFGDLAASIVMPANPVVVWLSLPVVAWGIWRLVRGFQPAILLLVIAFAAQWLPWIRVDRVTFFYHYATAIPFAIALLALLLARVHAGVSRRAWRVVRAGLVAVAFLPAVIWATTGPLCSTLAEDPAAGPCAAGWQMQLPLGVLLGIVAFVVAVALVAWKLADRWSRTDLADPDARQRRVVEGVVGAVVVLGVVIVALAVGRAGILDAWAVTLGSPLLVAVVAALIALPIASLAATATAPRRVVAGTLLASVIAFLLLWPAVVAIPMPISLVSVSQALLPTADTDFVFAATGSGGLPAGLVIIGLPMLAVGAGAWFAVRALDRRSPGPG